jgi:hypothetical protein
MKAESNITPPESEDALPLGGPEGREEFQPTLKMRLLAESYCAPGVKPDDESRAATAGVKPHTLQSWRRLPGFEDWLRDEVERELSASALNVWVAVRRVALEGNFQAAKLFLERFGGVPAKRGNEAMPETFHALAELAHLAAQQCAETISC